MSIAFKLMYVNTQNQWVSKIIHAPNYELARIIATSFFAEGGEGVYWKLSKLGVVKEENKQQSAVDNEH